MRILLFLFLSCGSLFTVKAQQCMTFQELNKNENRMAKLDSLFPSAVAGDTANKIFPGKLQQEFQAAWGNYFSGLFQYLADNGLVWGEQTYCFNKIYFSPDGSVQYWLFNFRQADRIHPDLQDQYHALITSYSKTHKIKIKAGSFFSQCASVDFIDVPPKKKRKKK
ncbi:MAG: hypothetical protein FD123_2769 [Bacteroidetes bacterium]|nr:MAG: hypothetical protein FD123_2769 [Bacteroidota bacterium]